MGIKMECYLDNAATTRPFASVRAIMGQAMELDYGNPSSLHMKGVEAEEYIKTARERIAKTLRAEAKEIVFTSGGTESNNQAIIGTALANRRRGKHLVTTCFEHASVYGPMEFLAEMGYEVTYLPVDAYGHVREEELREAIRPDTVLVSVMLVNNEVGAILDAAALSGVIKAKNPDTLLHVDAIQGYGKLTVCPKRQGIDLLSASGHKFHGPKGSGILYIRDGVKTRPILHGGGQQKNMRSGTENVPAIAGLGQAAFEIYQNHAEKVERLYGLKERFIREVRAAVPGCVVHALPEGDVSRSGEGSALSAAVRQTAPHIVSVGFPGVRSEVLLHALEEKGVYVSSGSACSSNHPGISGTLQAIGVGKECLDSTLRFSFGMFTVQEEIDYAVACLAELVPFLSRFNRR